MKISIKKDKTYLVDKDYYFPGDEYVIDLAAKGTTTRPILLSVGLHRGRRRAFR